MSVTMSQSESVQPHKERLPHSGLGCLSFIVALFAIGAFCLTPVIFFTYGEVLNELIPYNWEQENDPDPLPQLLPPGVFFPMLSSFLLASLAFALGIAAVCCQPHTRKVFAIWGIILSTAPFVLLQLVAMAARAGW